MSPISTSVDVSTPQEQVHGVDTQLWRSESAQPDFRLLGYHMRILQSLSLINRHDGWRGSLIRTTYSVPCEWVSDWVPSFCHNEARSGRRVKYAHAHFSRKFDYWERANVVMFWWGGFCDAFSLTMWCLVSWRVRLELIIRSSVCVCVLLIGVNYLTTELIELE